MEWIDKLRIFPRVALVCYFVGCGTALDWYFDFEVKYETRCDSNVLKVLLDEGVALGISQAIACPVVGVVGQPVGYTALMSTLVGAGAAIFGLYVNSGRKEE